MFHPNHQPSAHFFHMFLLCPSLFFSLPHPQYFHSLFQFMLLSSSDYFQAPNREPTVFPNISYLITQSLLSDFKDSMFFPSLHHSLPVSSNSLTVINERFTSKGTFHNNLIHVLRPLYSDNSRMTSGPSCRTREHLLGEEHFPAGPALFTPLLSEFWFDISLIRGIVNFRLHNHRYFYRDTISRWLPNKAKEHFKCP